MANDEIGSAMQPCNNGTARIRCEFTHFGFNTSDQNFENRFAAKCQALFVKKHCFACFKRFITENLPLRARKGILTLQ